MIDSFPLKDYLALCKLKVVALMLLCTLVGMVLASTQLPPWPLVCYGCIGIGLACASGAAINHVIDRHIDGRMARTTNRPLPKQQLSCQQAIIFALIIGSSGIAILAYYVNQTAALWTLSALLGYGVIYTAILKHLTPQNIVIGGLSGALPPLLGWACINPHLGPQPWLLVLIIYAWTPPHFWALAIAKLDEYQNSQLPMLPVTHGVTYTKINIQLYTWLLIASTGLPYAIAMFHWPYLLGSQLLNIRMLQWTHRLKRSQNPKTALQTFMFSIYYLMWLFVLMLADHLYYAYA